MSERMIHASEIAEYAYCHRAWWLRRAAGYPSDNIREMAAGTAYHRRHGSQVNWAFRLQGLALVLLFAAIAVLVFWLVQGL